MIDSVLCTAPLTALIVDTNKGVRPCCVYDDAYLGSLKTEHIVNIINGKEWQDLKQKMYNKELPKACVPCKEREDKTGWGLRHLFNQIGNNFFNVEGWDKEKITYMEFNGSNICNLACLHCNAGFSSRWVKDVSKAKTVFETYDEDLQKRIAYMDALLIYTDDHKGRSTKMHLPDPELIIENLKEIDLTYLKTLNFKGGEPFLNSETTAILEHLDSQDILKNLDLSFSTNGTYITDQQVGLLDKCKHVAINLSVDGTDSLFNYIRYGDAKFDDIEPTIQKLNQVSNIQICVQTAIMNYNIFNLLDIMHWTEELSEKYNKVRSYPGFSNVIQEPKYLSINTLSDNTRKELYDFYVQHNQHGNFEVVLTALKSNYIGDRYHNDWIDYTNLMQTVRKNNILSIVPELEKEFHYVNG